MSGTAQPRGTGLARLAVPAVGLRAAGQALEFMAWILLARRLGTSSFGVLTVAFLACRYAGLVADWGAVVGGSRDVAAQRDPAHLRALVRHRAMVGMGLAAAFCAAVVLARRPEMAPLAATIAARGVSRDWVALGRERGVLSGVPGATQGLLAVALAIPARSVLSGATAIGVAYAMAGLVSVAANRLPPVVAGSAGTGRRRVERWLLIALMADQVTASLDTLLLAGLRGTAAAGIYAAVYRIPNAWVNVTGLTGAALVPVATRLHASDRAGLVAFHRRAQRIAGLAAAGLLAMIPVAWVLLPWLLGNAYAPGRTALAILLGATAVGTVAVPLHPVVMAGRRDRRLAAIACSGAAVNVVLNIALIPPMGIEGAALATLASAAALLVLLRRTAIQVMHGAPEGGRPLALEAR